MQTRWIWPFELREKIGVGGMGVVYRGRYVKDGRLVAVKLLPDEVTQNETVAARFRREMELLKSLKHPHIVQCFGGVSDEKQAFYAMELVEGGTLGELLRRKGRFSPAEVARYGLQMCSALACAHGQNIIHRDVKPGNFLLTEEGNLKLSDFGIAFVAGESRLTSEGKTVGSFPYMAPEQIRGKPPLSRQTDLYALGCVLYEMLTGRPPFTAETPGEMMRKHLEEAPASLTDLVPDCPVPLENVVLRLLEKDPQKRPANANEVATILEEFAEDPAATRASSDVAGQQTAAAIPVRSQPRRRKVALEDRTTLSRLQPIAWGACLLLIAVLSIWNADLREKAARVEQAGTLWIEALEDRDNPPELRRTAADALGRLDPNDPRAIEALEATLQDPDAELRSRSALALGEIGSAARDSRPVLRKILQQDPEPYVRHAASNAIRTLDAIEPRSRGWLWGGVLLLLVGVGIGWWIRREIRIARKVDGNRERDLL